jgi:hypothetical protein
VQITRQFLLEDCCDKDGRSGDQRGHGNRHLECLVNVSGLEVPSLLRGKRGHKSNRGGPQPQRPDIGDDSGHSNENEIASRSVVVLNHAIVRCAANMSAIPSPRIATPPPPTDIMVAREMGFWSMEVLNYCLIASMKSRYGGPSMF